MEYTLKLKELIDRPLIRDDQFLEFLNKMSNDEINQYEDEIDIDLTEEGVKKESPTWVNARLTKMIDKDVLYNLFKHVNLLSKGDSSVKNLWIGLTRVDLQRNKSTLSINEITLFDFKASALSRQQMDAADRIVFNDVDGKLKELKNRYAAWPLDEK